MKIKFCALVSIVLSLLGAELQAGNLKVNLAPAQAVSAGAQWRVDGGSWRDSGTTATNLSNSSHVVSYKAVSGWITPANASVTLSGSATTTLTGTYVSPAALKINLTPTTGKWRIDGGSWQNNGATVSGLTPGSHSVDYQAVSGFNSPAAESVTLTAGQTTTLTRAYVQLAQLTVNLTPSTGQWRIDGGAWRNSGTTATGLTPGAHNLEFASVGGFSSPPAESVSLAAGQSLTLARTYTALAKLRITLAPTTGKWRIDGGVWQDSGVLVSNLTPGNHNVDYQALVGFAAPASETVALISNQTTTLTRSYTQLAQLTITLTPAAGRWRVDGGAWLAGGAVAANLAPGNHAVEYQALAGFTAPSSETVALSAGQNATLTRAYVQLATVTVTLTPGTAQWRVDGGAWLANGAVASNLTPGTHSIDYAPAAGFTAPASESVALASGQSLSLARSYVPFPQLSIVLSPAAAQWRVDGGAWQASGATLTLAPGTHSVEYAPRSDWIAPATESIALAGGQVLSLSRNYTPVALLVVTLDPSSAQWRLDGGAWMASGAPILNIPLGTHTIEYSALPGYIAPPTESVVLVGGINPTLTRTYTQLATFGVTLNPTSAQWRIDGGAWNASGTSFTNLALGAHTIEYSAVSGYITPPAESVTLIGGINPPFNRAYAPLASFGVTLNPATAQWRMVGAPGTTAWFSSGTFFTGITPGTYTIEFSDVQGYITPAPVVVTLVSGPNPTLTRTYAPLASFGVTLNPATAQWRMVGAPGTTAWFSSGTSFTGITPGTYTIEFSNVAGYITPDPVVVTLVSGSNPTLTRSYSLLPQISITLTPASGEYIGKWRVDGGTWQASGATVLGLTPGPHTISYLPLPFYSFYANLPDETVNLSAGQSLTLSRSYPLLAATYTILNPASAQWRVDGGAWTPTGVGFPIFQLSVGDHLIEYSDVPGYIAPLAETVTLVAGPNPPITRSYTQLATFGVNLTPASAQWRIDGGGWNASQAFFINLSVGTHTIEYSTVPGYITPPDESVTLVGGINQPLVRNYAQLASVHVTTTPAATQWRIDGGAWWPSGSTTLNNLSFGVPHTVEFLDLPGYVTPPAQTFIFAAGELREVTATFQKLASVHVTTTPPTTQWRIDGGAWWPSGSTTLNNLSFGVPHTVEFLDLPGYVTPPAQTFTLAAGELREVTATFQKLASVHVTTTPPTAQWRIDGGAWWPSGSTTLNNLAFGVSHTVEFSELPGYYTPAAQTFTLFVGEQREVTAYYGKITSLSITLNLPSAQWRVDGGAWRASGAIVDNLSAGSRIVEYTSVAGYTAPPTETVTLTAGQTLSLSRSYISTTTQLTVTLTPASGQWRLATGTAWLASGTTIDVTSGEQIIYYLPLAGYNSPLNDTLTVTRGQSVALTRNYTLVTAPPKYTAALIPSLNGNWSSGNAINNSSAMTGSLYLGGGTLHACRYSGGVMQDLETLGGTFSFGSGINSAGTIAGQARTAGGATHAVVISGDAMQDLGTLGGTYSAAYDINDAGVIVGASTLATGKYHAFRYDAGNWVDLGTLGGDSSYAFGINQSGAIVGRADNAAGASHAFVLTGGAMQDLGTLGGSASTAFDINDAGIVVGEANTTAGTPHAFVFSGGSLQDLGTIAGQASSSAMAINNTGTVVGWTYTNQQIDLRPFVYVDGVMTDLNTLVNLPGVLLTYANDINDQGQIIVHGTDFVIDMDFILTPVAPPSASLQVNLNPVTAQWRIDGGNWNNSGATLNNLSPGTHGIEYKTVAGYILPPAESITLVAGDNQALTRTYTQLASFGVTLNPTTAQWRMVGTAGTSAWFSSGTSLTQIALGTYTIEFSDIPGYIKPVSEVVTLVSGPNPPLTRSYTALATFGVTLNPTSAQWRIDGGGWNASGALFTNLTIGAHLIEYSTVPGYITPSSDSVTLVSGTNPSLIRTYTPLATFSVNLTPTSAQWRIDGGSWNASGASFTNLTIGAHLIEYSPVPGYVTPRSDSVTLVSGTNPPLVRSYVQLASFSVNLTPVSAQWRIDGGSWNVSGTLFNNLTLGTHLIEYSPIPGYVTPPSDSVTLVSGINPPLVRSYAQLASVHVLTTPATTQWRIDGGTWWMSGSTTVNNLALGVPHTVEFSSLEGYVTPPAQTFTLLAGELREVTATYPKLASVHVLTTPATTEWRIDGGAWWMSGSTTVNNLAFGVPHTVEFKDLPGYVTPPAQTFTLLAGELREVTATYPKLASVHVLTTPATTQWRIDGGTWWMSGSTTVNNLAFGVPHTVEFKDLPGYATPPAQTFTLLAGELREVTATYLQFASLSVTLNPLSAQWRVDSGAWQASGVTVTGLTASSHVVEYSALAGYVSPGNDTLSLTPGQSLTLNRTYAPVSGQQYSVTSITGAGKAVAINASGSVVGSGVGSQSHAYRFTGGILEDLGSLGADTSLATGINDSGVVTGFFLTAAPDYYQHAFRYESGTMTDLGVLGTSRSSAARAINNAGIIVGVAESLPSVGNHAFRYTSSVMTDLGNFGGSQAAALGINDSGVIVGTVLMPDGSSKAVRYAGSTVEVLPDLGGTSSAARGINNAGVIVGESTLPGGSNPHAFRHQSGVTSDLGTLGGARSQALALNNAGAIVGWAEIGGNIKHAFLYRSGVMTDLNGLVNLPGIVLTEAVGINASGQIVANDSDSHAHILTPIVGVGGLQVTLTPTTGQWRVDGGAWQASGATVLNLTAGNHLVEYASLDGYFTPASENVTITISQSLQITRSYTVAPLASVYVSLNPNGILAQWRIDGGSWRNSSSSANNLTYGVPHTIEYSNAEGYVAPPTATVTLISGEFRSINATYTPLASVYVSLNPNGILAQWRIDGGAWRNSSSSANNLTYGVPHTIEYSNAEGYVAPPTATVTLISGEFRSINATYTPLASVYVSLNPNGVLAQWRIDGGSWRNSSSSANNLTYGVPHTIEYSNAAGYVAPPAATVTLLSGEFRSINATYAPLASVYVTLNPNGVLAQWRIDGGSWRNSSSSANNLTYGVSHTIEYSNVAGYATPPNATVTLLSGEFRSVNATYTPLASVYVSLNPVFAMWRIDGGNWNSSGITVNNLVNGPHSLEFSRHEGYLTPPAETITLNGSSNSQFRTYAVDPTFSVNPTLAKFTAVLDPKFAEWRFDGGSWNTSGASLHNLALGTHGIEYKALADYISPPAESVTLVAGTNPVLYTEYISIDPAQLTVTTTPASGQWRVYPYQWPAGGTWQASGTTATGLNPGAYTVEYAPLNGYTLPVPGYVELLPDGSGSLSASYGIINASLRVLLNPATARYRINSGVWRLGGPSSLSIAPGTYTIEFEPVAGYVAPATVTITLGSGQVQEYTYTYTPQ